MSRPLDTVPRYDLFIASAVVTVAILPSFMTGALAVQMRAELEATPAIIGLAIGGFFAASALGSAPMGRLVERIGAGWGMRLCSAGAALVLGAVALLAHSTLRLMAILVVGGAINAFANPASNLFLARTMPEGRRGLVFGIKQSAIPVATFLAGLAVPGLALTVGWRWAFVLAAAAGLVLAVAIPRKERPGSDFRSRSVQPPAEPAMSTLVLVALAGAAALAIFGGQSLGAFLVSFAVEVGISEAAAGWLLAMSSVAGIASRIMSGWIIDSHGRGGPRPRWGLRGVAVLLVLGALGYAMLATEVSAMAWVAAPLAFAGGWGWSGLLTYSVVEANPATPAASTGVAQTGIFVGASLGPPTFGAIAEAVSYRAAWLAVAAGALAALGVLMAVEANLHRE
ncbi:MAG: MFS transporter [Acidimicrobiia bacterium]